MFIFCLLQLPLLIVCVGPIWKTPVSEPHQSRSDQNSNLTKRAQPNYYTRPDQVSIPDYRSPQLGQQIESRGKFQPFAWIGPQPKFGSPQTSFYNRAPNKEQSWPINGLPPLPPNWQQYPVQMIWIPDGPPSSPNIPLNNAPTYYDGPNGVPSTPQPQYGLYGPASPELVSTATRQPSSPAYQPDTYQGTVVHSPSATPTTFNVDDYTVPHYGGRRNEEKTTSESILTTDTQPTLTTSLNPTIRPGPQEPSEPNYSTTFKETSTLSSETKDEDQDFSKSSKIPLFEMTSNPFVEKNIGRTVPPVYLESEENEEDEAHDTTTINADEGSSLSPEKEEEEMVKNFYPRPISTQGYAPPAHTEEDFQSHINVNFKKPKGCTASFCHGVDADKISLYKPDRDENDDEGTGPTLVISNAAKDDASRSGYKPPTPATVNPYVPPPPPVYPTREDYEKPFDNHYNLPFPPFKEYNGMPFIPKGYIVQTIPPQPSPPPRALIPAHMLTTTVTSSSELPKMETDFEAKTSSFIPTAQTISTNEYIVPTSSESPTTKIKEEDDIESTKYFPPSVIQMTTSTSSDHSRPTFVPLHPETTIETTTLEVPSNLSTQTPATITRKIELSTKRNEFTSVTPSKDENIVPGSTRIPSLVTSSEPFTTPSTFSYSEITEMSSTSSETFTTPSFFSKTFPTSSYSKEIEKSSTPNEKLTPSSLAETTEISVTFPSYESTTSWLTFSDYVTPSAGTISPARFTPKNPYSPPEGIVRVPNRLIGKPRILCKEDGISFEVKTILPLTGEVFANDRKRISECQKTFNEEKNPKFFLRFDKCGVKNVGEQIDNRAQYHMQVVLVIDQGNGTTSLQSFMAQCVHQKINYNKQALPKRIQEALEELRLIPSKLEQKASMPNAQMQIVVDEGHHKLGAEVKAADIGMPLALKWQLQPESDAYGMHIRNCKVVDAVGKIEHLLIDEQGCSADLQIIDHPHYDTYHDTASAHMWAFKVPDMASLKIKCDILICSNIKNSATNSTSCQDIPSPPFCADVVTSPPNSILSDVVSFVKPRRDAQTLPMSQSVRTSICLSKTCQPQFSDEIRVCVNKQLVTTSTGLSVAFFLFSISFQIIVRSRK